MEPKKKEDGIMITIGVDFHKKTSSYRFLDEKGIPIKRCKLPNDPDVIKRLLSSLPGEKQLAMEATRSWGLFYECVKDHVDHFYLGHPKKMKAITNSETKNDNTDADAIAKLTYSGFLPKAHVSSIDIRQLRSLVRYRSYLVNQRRSVRNQVHSIIDRNVWPCHKPASFKNIFCKRGRQWLDQLSLPERERFILDQCLQKFDHLNKEIQNVETYIKSQEHELPGVKYLKTVPGFRTSVVNLYCVLVETSDIKRFRKAKGFAYYAGFIPRERSSGEKKTMGRLVKGSNMHLRTAIIESTLSAIRVDKGLQSYYKQVKARRGSGAAIISTARKLSYAIYHVLKEQREYKQHEFEIPVAACHPTSAMRIIIRK
jgi:transposase